MELEQFIEKDIGAFLDGRLSRAGEATTTPKARREGVLAPEELALYAPSRDYAKELDKALDLEPNNFATLVLLGDFEVRSGHPATARAYYQRARSLNPRDIGLQQLAAGRFAGG